MVKVNEKKIQIINEFAIKLFCIILVEFLMYGWERILFDSFHGAGSTIN